MSLTWRCEENWIFFYTRFFKNIKFLTEFIPFPCRLCYCDIWVGSNAKFTSLNVGWNAMIGFNKVEILVLLA